MTSSRMKLRILAVVALAAALAGCNETRNPGYQGWVEADLIFVSPDESGRVTKLNVREGDEVKAGAPLYSVDDDLQQADLNQNNATLANARQTFDRAQTLSKTGSGTIANLDSAVSALRVAEARVNTSQTRLTRRNSFAPVNGTIQQIYFREGETVPAQRPVLSIMPPGNMKIRFYVPEPDLPKLAIGDEVRVACDNCAGDLKPGNIRGARAADIVRRDDLHMGGDFGRPLRRSGRARRHGFAEHCLKAAIVD